MINERAKRTIENKLTKEPVKWAYANLYTEIADIII
jgi:hypothetical protein